MNNDKFWDRIYPLLISLIPTTAIFVAGIVFSAQLIALEGRVGAEMTSLKSDLSSRMASLEDRVGKQMIAVQSDLSSRMGMLEDRVDARMGMLEDRVDARMGTLEDRMGIRFDEIEQHLSDLSGKISANSTELEDLRAVVRARK